MSTNYKKEQGFAPLDMFGPEISLTFQGQRQFKTKFGGIVSVLTITLFFIIVAIKAEQILVGFQTAAFFTTKTTHDVNDPINLKELDYTFAVNEIDPTIARLNVFAVDWRKGERKVKTPIPMVDCRDVQDQLDQSNGVHPISHEALTSNRFYGDAVFLCPNTTELLLKGKGDSEMFSYVEIKIIGCDLPDDQCADNSEIDNTYVTFF